MRWRLKILGQCKLKVKKGKTILKELIKYTEFQEVARLLFHISLEQRLAQPLPFGVTEFAESMRRKKAENSGLQFKEF